MAEIRKASNPGNFAQDREKAARAGHIGGQNSSGNFANNRERAVEAGRKGGQASHSAGAARNATAAKRSGDFDKGPDQELAAGSKGDRA